MALPVLTVRIPDALNDGLSAVSTATGRSVAELTRTAIADYLERNIEEFKIQAKELAAREMEQRKSAIANMDDLMDQVRELATADEHS